MQAAVLRETRRRPDLVLQGTGHFCATGIHCHLAFLALHFRAWGPAIMVFIKNVQNPSLCLRFVNPGCPWSTPSTKCWVAP